MKQHNLWTEKYRPDVPDNYVGHEELKEQVGKWQRTNALPNLIFYGPTGTGKTTLAKLLSTSLNCTHIYLNASDENGIDTVREKIKNFASAASFKPLKVVIYDDCHNLTPDAQNALLNLIESYSKTTRFIFTTNHLDKLIPALQGRCTRYKVQPPSKPEVAIYLAMILDKEGVEYETGDIVKIVKKCFPDIRSCVNAIQNCTTEENKLVISYAGIIAFSYLRNIVDILKSPGKDAWQNIRQIIVDSNITDFTEVFKYLYNTADEFAAKGYEEVIFAISQAQYQQYFVPDKEINAAEMFLKILKAIR